MQGCILLSLLLSCTFTYIHTESLDPYAADNEKDYLFLQDEEPIANQGDTQPIQEFEAPQELMSEDGEDENFELLLEDEPKKIEPIPAPVQEPLSPTIADEEGPVIIKDRVEEINAQLEQKAEALEKEEEVEFNGPQGEMEFVEHEKQEDVIVPKTKRELVIPGPGFFSLKKADAEMVISGKYRPENFYGKNLTFLNNCNDLDKVFYFRHTLDINVDATYGKERFGYDAAQFKFTLRNKGIWGNTASIAPTSEATVREVDENFGAHRHGLGKHVIWIREAWLKASWNAIFKTDQHQKHSFILGFFPFRLGHGIALGDAFAVNPGLLGFYTENNVDQYAPGFLLTGEIIPDRLQYDIYGAIFEDKADSLSNNADPVYAQKFGCTPPLHAGRDNPARGFGDVNWLIAGRLQAVIYSDSRIGTIEFEPYILYNDAPEQRIEFPADSESKLATFGFDIDYERDNFQASFEFARNFGRQLVQGWDRNQIISQLNSTTAAVTHVNSKVTDSALGGANALDTKSNQASINTSIQDETQNGLPISGTTLVNADDRFSNPFKNEYKGWMFVFDAGYWFLDKQIQLAFAAGYASGDENPSSNFDDPKAAPVNSTPQQPGKHNFHGFVGLQEIFNGEKVESAYVLGQRKVTRPLSLPNDAIENEFFAATISEFTNIAYVATGAHIKPKWANKFYWRPNILFYWQPKGTRAFDLATKTVSTTKFARSFLGTELNTFVDIFPFDSLKATFVISGFFPGAHYKDIQGEPVNKTQVQIINDIDDEDVAFDVSQLPLLGTDPAFSFNFALEYRF